MALLLPAIPPSEPRAVIPPLKAANLRLNKKAAQARPPKPKPPKPPKPAKLPGKRGRGYLIPNPDLVIGMKAAGVPQVRIAEALGTSHNVITNTLNRDPHSRERIAELREKLKGIKMEKAHRLEGRVWERLEKEVDTGEAKDVDAISRSLLALEKIQAGVSGEGAASGASPVVPTNLDLKVLIQNLLDP